MDKLELTEKEAIELTIKSGYGGEELTSAKYKRLGCLDGQKDKVTGTFKNRAMIKFIRKLETIYESVEVVGKGKKRKYILQGKRDVMVEIEDRRKFNGVTNNSVLFKDKHRDKLKYYIGDNHLLEQATTYSKNKLGLWICEKCHNQFKDSFNNLSWMKGCKCKKCRGSNGERAIIDFLEKHGYLYEKQYIFNDLKGVKGGALRFDFAVFEDDKLICLIEYDGEYHDEKYNKHNYDYVHKHDELKDIYCEDRNIPLCRIKPKDLKKLKNKLIKCIPYREEISAELHKELKDIELKLKELNNYKSMIVKYINKAC